MPSYTPNQWQNPAESIMLGIGARLAKETRRLQKVQAMLAEYPAVKNPDEVRISRGNTKLHNVWSFSTMPGITCPEGAKCYRACYARRGACRFRFTARAYLLNTMLLLTDLHGTYRQIESKLLQAKTLPVAFRFNVAGELTSEQELLARFRLAKRFPSVKFLMYTKRHDLVQEVLIMHDKPANLQLVLSVWPGMMHVNRFDLPEAHVAEFNTASAEKPSVKCIWNCEECAKRNIGCFALKNGEQVIFPKH